MSILILVARRQSNTCLFRNQSTFSTLPFAFSVRMHSLYALRFRLNRVQYAN